MKDRIRTSWLCCLLLLCPLSALSQDWWFDDDSEFVAGVLRYVVNDERGIAECRGFAEGQSAKSLTIPATVSHSGRSYNVVSVGEYAFEGTSVSSLTLSEGLRVVRTSAFYGCPVTTVTVPASVTELQEGAFYTETLTEAHLLSPSIQLGFLVFSGGLQHLYMSAVTPPELYIYLAMGQDFVIPLVRVHVPQGASAAYLANNFWACYVIMEGDAEVSATVSTQRAGMLAEAVRGQGLHFKGIHHLTLSGPLGGDDIRFIRDSLTNVLSLDMSQTVIRELPREAFEGCRFSSIQLPATLRDMGGSAFSACNYLEELTLPEGVREADNLVLNCQRLKSIDLPSTLLSAQRVLSIYNFDETKTMRCTITCRSFFPPKGGSYPVFTYGNTDVRLRVPAISASAYAAATGWKDLTQEAVADIVPQQITVVGNRELSTDGLPSGYKPDMDLAQFGDYGGYSSNNAFGWLTVSGGQPLSLGAFKAFTDVYSDRWYNGHYGSEMLAEAPMTAETVDLDLLFLENSWHFMSFPFDVKLSDVKTDSRIQYWVVRTYSGANRAAMRGEQWRDVPYESTLEAGRGYIWMVSSDGNTEDSNYDDMKVSVKAATSNHNNIFAREDVSVPLYDYASTYEHNAGWNFVGNPYPCYYRLGGLKQTMPVTVFSGYYDYDQYRTYSPVDDADRMLRPYEAFFVQKPAGSSALVFGAEGRVAPGRSSNARANTPVATMSGGSPVGIRQLLNLTLTAGNLTDYTRVVLNPDAKTGYERERDAAKFFSDSQQVPQLYSFIGSEPCAINERPVSDGTIALGLRTGSAQQCTISLDEPIEGVMLKDRLMGTLTDLSAEAYTFTSQPGRDDSRFLLHVGGSATGVLSVAVSQQQAARPACNLQGQPVSNSYKGIVIENGRLTIKR